MNPFITSYIALQHKQGPNYSPQEINLFVGSHGTIELFETHLFWSKTHETPQ